MLGILDASRFITMSDGEGRREDWWMRRWVRLESVSLATTIPDGIGDEFTSSSACNASKSCAVYSHMLATCEGVREGCGCHTLEPGAAHMSITYSESSDHTEYEGGNFLPYGGVLLEGIEVEAC